jgi:PAS domain S-box-containing protein
VVAGATDALMDRLTVLGERARGRWVLLLWTAIASSLLAIAFGAVLLLYRRDFVRRVKVEAALGDSDERVRLLLDSTGEAIYGIDLEGRCTFANAACIELLGYRSTDQLIGEDLHGRIHAGANGPRDACPLHGLHGSVHREEEELRRSDGSRFPAECWSHPIERNGEVIGRVITFVDITDRKRAETELRHSQKMESVGRLAGGVAHDFNNLLTAIDGFATLSQAAMPQGSPAWEDIEQIKIATQRAAALTRQLLVFGRRQASEVRHVDLSELLSRMERLLHPLIGETIRLELRLSPEPAVVRVDAGQIEQVVVNLVVNARDAMPAGGRIIIETRRMELDDAFRREHAGTAPGRYVMFSVTDSGVGIPADIQTRIFEPFFTTKEVGKGTGLGLATCYAIVKQHGGNIWCYSEMGRGTTFKVYLPRVDSAADGPEPARPEASRRGHETILLVEDEPGVRQVALRALSASGYRVHPAGDGGEAMRIAESLTTPVDLLITDVVMPGMDGIELGARLRERHPGTRVLYMSGYSEAMLSRQGLGGPAIDLLEKPFTPEKLLRQVHGVLKGTPHSSAGDGAGPSA